MSAASVDSTAAFLAPAGYAGLHGFHKYWGKKPPETMRFLLQHLTRPGALVCDPFVGSGSVAEGACGMGRRFVGGDINPVAVAISSLLLQPPAADRIARALSHLTAAVSEPLRSLYRMQCGQVATHYLWEHGRMVSVWTTPPGARKRVEFSPTQHDIELSRSLSDYRPHALRPLNILQNSRINARQSMGWQDLFTGRALFAIESLRAAIDAVPDEHARAALRLCLTASVGQMSKMVFAIKRRGRVGGAQRGGRLEVGSWVVGLWTPPLGFEVNAWNCFVNRANRLVRALQAGPSYYPSAPFPLGVLRGDAPMCLQQREARELLDALPAGSVDLLLTDPPHGDRIPYLEMSEIWNAILDQGPNFDDELVVSNASARGKTRPAYAAQLADTFSRAGRVLSPAGVVALMFNSKSKAEWDVVLGAMEVNGLRYRGQMPMAYSAGSVVQDSRKGGLGHDIVLFFTHRANRSASAKLSRLQRLAPGFERTRAEPC